MEENNMELNYELLKNIINIDSPTGYCNKVIKYIEESQGSVPAEYQISLMMLRNNLYYYMQSYDSCIENGLVYAGKDGRQYLTQTWRVLQDTEKRMMDILRQFGLTTMSRSQIKTSQNSMTAEELLRRLTEE